MTDNIIHFNFYDPAGFNIFKPERNARAEIRTIACSCDNCPLLKKRQCQCLSFLEPECPYAHVHRELGPTKRSQKLGSWIRERKKKYEGVPWLSAPDKKMEFIGEYAYLPYAHMSVCKKLNFVRRQFLPKQDWTIENVIILLDFIPLDWLGGRITTYQVEQVPKFLLHLREQDPEMWKQLIEKRPHLDEKPNHVGRKAYLSTLNYPIEWVESSENYPVSWKWDGAKLTTDSMNAYDKPWGKIKLESVQIVGTPIEKAVVVVQSNDWVNDNTEFVD
jgi:hypothetical protein